MVIASQNVLSPGVKQQTVVASWSPSWALPLSPSRPTPPGHHRGARPGSLGYTAGSTNYLFYIQLGDLFGQPNISHIALRAPSARWLHYLVLRLITWLKVVTNRPQFCLKFFLLKSTVILRVKFIHLKFLRTLSMNVMSLAYLFGGKLFPYLARRYFSVRKMWRWTRIPPQKAGQFFNDFCLITYIVVKELEQ